MIDNIPKEISENPTLVNKFYDDALQPACTQLGKTVEALLKFVALPFTFLGLTAEQLEKKYKSFIEKTINKVPVEKRIPPKSAIVSPLLDHVKYLFDDEQSENLIEMFSDLLANTINQDTSPNTHVSYIHTLKQLGWLEAKILDQMYFSEDFGRVLGFAFKRNLKTNASSLSVLSDEAEPLMTIGEDKNVFYFYDLIILEDNLNVSNSNFSEALNILQHHNLIKSFKINKYKDKNHYSLEKHDKANINEFDPYESIIGYSLTQYARDFMFSCNNPTSNKNSEFQCRICNCVFQNIHQTGLCPSCGSDNVILLKNML